MSIKTRERKREIREVTEGRDGGGKGENRERVFQLVNVSNSY